ncbi:MULTISPECIES: DUF6483 family protein [Clostridium]|uniref:DUF6483 family protein n=1 Tax=Clostridium lapidicellarium TaxID=3240931 RepID=A0ABV4DWH8_9CLOT
MNDDYIMRIIESLKKFTGNLFSKEQDQDVEYQNIDLQSLSLEDMFPLLLKKLVVQGKYDEAENMLFEELDENPSHKLFETGKKFYGMLLLKSDEQLAGGNFSRKEIFQGLEDMKKVFLEHKNIREKGEVKKPDYLK